MHVSRRAGQGSRRRQHRSAADGLGLRATAVACGLAAGGQGLLENLSARRSVAPDTDRDAQVSGSDYPPRGRIIVVEHGGDGGDFGIKWPGVKGLHQHPQPDILSFRRAVGEGVGVGGWEAPSVR